MNLASRKTVQFLCKKYGFWPSRSSGQNFLISEKALHAIVESAHLVKEDAVLEIGGGFGTLTTELIKRASTVVTVELDKRLIKALKKLASVNKNLSVIAGDIFQQWPHVAGQLSDLQYKLVANLPYNITSLVLRNFLEQRPRPSEMVLLVQKEVAARVVARPGQMSLLSVAVQFYGVPEIVRTVSREDFWPAPAVDSAILKIQGISRDIKGYQGALGGMSTKKFFSLVKIGFSAKRKQLHNNVSAGLHIDSGQAKAMLSEAGLNPASRAQDLAIEDWVKIAHNVGDAGEVWNLT